MSQKSGVRHKLFISTLIVAITLVLSTAGLCAADDMIEQSEILKKAEALISEKKYYSAFMDLQEADPENTDVDITLKKLQIVLDYFVLSLNHRIFSLTDLEPHQEIGDVRGKKGTSQVVSFDSPEVLANLNKKHPEDFRIQKAMGEYYAEVLKRYGGRWELPDEGIVSLSRDYYSQAMENGVVDSRLYFQLGYYHMLDGDWINGIEMLKKAVSLEETYGSAHYNLAYAYLQLNERQKAITHAERALKLYDSPGYKADAAIMLAKIHGKLGNREKVLEYYQKADAIDPGNFYTLRSLVNIYARSGRMDLASKKSKELFDLDPDNPTSGKELIKAYFHAKAVDHALILFNDLKGQYSDDSEIMGNIYFHEAQLLYWDGKREAAVERMNEAQEYFKIALEPDHAVFKVIEDFLEE